MIKLLHELNFAYKKPKFVPGKADTEAQRQFVGKYENIRENMDENDVVCFVDGVHPQ